MNCTHNHRDPSTIKYGAQYQRSWKCLACEKAAALQKSHEELEKQVAVMAEQIKQLNATLSALKYQIEMQRPLILR